ncbi:radical SAM protein [Nanoarchaeota archaeon]
MRTEIKLGTVCNNNCVFCLNEKHGVTNDSETIMQRIIHAKEKGVDRIQFTGGEPTISKDFFKFVGLANNLGLGISVQTNGRTCSYEKFALRTMLSGASGFLVSLHAHNEELNRKITQVPGGFEQTKKGIKNIIKHSGRVTINCVVNSLNVTHLPEIAAHHAKLGADLVQLSWCRPQGKVKVKVGDLIPAYTNHVSFLEQALDILKKEGVRAHFYGVPLCLINHRYVPFFGDPYASTVVLSQEMQDARKWIANERECYVDKCQGCQYKDKECTGFFKKYVEHYGPI